MAEELTWPGVTAKVGSLGFSEEDQGYIRGRLLAMPSEMWARYLDGSDAMVRGQLLTLLPAAAAQTSIPPAGGKPTVIHFVFHKAKDKTKASFEYAFSTRPTFEQVCQVLEEYHPELVRKQYMLKANQLDITKSTWAALNLTPPQESKRLHRTIAVVLKDKAFSGFSKDEGLQLLGVSGAIAASDFAPDSFQAAPLNDVDELPEEIKKRTNWTTVGCVLRHLANDLACRSYVSRTHEAGKEQGKRELVAPFLMAAAAIVAEIQVHAEFNVDGTCAHGSVDWVMLYKALCIVVVEAKLHAPFVEYLGQLAAEMVSAREDFAMTVMKKRKFEAASALPKVPSYGILTNGHYMQFYKYYIRDSNDKESGGEEKVLLQSDLIPVPISSDTSQDAACTAARPIVEKLVHILRAQIDEYNECPIAKKQRT